LKRRPRKPASQRRTSARKIVDDIRTLAPSPNIPTPERVHRAGIYEEIDLSEWIAGNPLVLATNFSKLASLFQKFPTRDVFISDKNGEK
jgi:hypothetical protein